MDRVIKGVGSVLAFILFLSNLLQRYNALNAPYLFFQEHWHSFLFRSVVLGLLIPAPFTLEIIAWLRPRIKVSPTPSGKGFPEIYLNVLNQGRVKKFNAKCEVLASRNDPNAIPSGVHDLKWDHVFTRTVSFSKHDSMNLLVASIDGGGPRESSLSLCALDGQVVRKYGGFTWSLDPQDQLLPVYDIRITILSDDAIKPQTYECTLRPNVGRTFVEMVKTEVLS